MTDGGIQQLWDTVQWEPVPAPTTIDSEYPHVTHEGLMRFAAVNLRAYQLSNGQRFLDADDVHTLFGVAI